MTSITFSALDPAGVESIEKSPIQIDLAGGTISFSGVDSPISLIITFNTENQAPASMREIADRCYADLDEAAAIFKRIDFKRKHLIQPDLNVAKNANPLIDFDKMGYQSVQSAPSRNGAAGMKAPETRNGRHSETVREPESVLLTNPVVE